MKHRKLDLQKFFNVADEEKLTAFLNAKKKELNISDDKWDLPSYENEAVLEWLGEGESSLKEQILESILQINDVCLRTMNILNRAMERYRIEIIEDEKRENTALRIYVENKKAFDYAHDLYYFLCASSQISEHNIEADEIGLSDMKKSAFESRVRKHFGKNNKGNECDVRFYDGEHDSLLIAVVRGSYTQTVATWDGKNTKIISFRPAKEDILEYKTKENKLFIKTSYQKERDFYLKAFAEVILEDVDQVERDDRDTNYCLDIFKDDQFSFETNEVIQAVRTVEIIFLTTSRTNPEIHIKSDDVFLTIKDEFPHIRLSETSVTYIKICLDLRIDNKDKSVSFHIAPPNTTDLNSKKYQREITEYLKTIGVKKDAQVSSGTDRKKEPAMV